MNTAPLHAVPADPDTLLGYEGAMSGHSRQLAVFIAPDLDTFNALDSQGLPAIYPRDGVWLPSHAELVLGWELVFIFSNAVDRIAAASVFDGYARQLLILTDEKVGHTDLVSYLVANDSDIDSLIDLSDRARVYDYHAEKTARESVIPLEGQRKAQADYPVTALGPIMGPMVKAIEQSVQVSTPLAAQSVLAVASLVAQQYADVKPPYFGAKNIPCSNYFLTIAESGERKSAANNVALDPMMRWETHLAERHEHQSDSYRRAKSAYDKMVTKAESKAKSLTEARQLIEAIGDEPTRPLSPSIILNEPTIEGFLKSADTSHAGRAIITDEAGAILGGHSMTSEKKQYTITTLSKLWDASSIVMARVGRDTPAVRNKRLTMHLMGQGVVINPLLADPLAQGQGFLARFLTVSAPARAGFRKREGRANSGDYRPLYAWRDHVTAILQGRTVRMKSGTDNELEPTLLTLDDEAYQVWGAFADKIETAQRPGGAYAEIKPFASKAAEHVLRMAGIFAVIEQEAHVTAINGPTVSRAVELVQFYTDEHLRLVEMNAADPRLTAAGQLIDWIKANRGSYVYKNDLRQHGPSRLRKSADLSDALAVLCEHNHIKAIDAKMIDGALRQNSYEVLV